MRFLKIFALGMLLAFVFLIAWFYLLVLRGLPSVDELKCVRHTNLVTILAADGSPIAYIPPDGRIVIDGSKIPLVVKQAFIAAEDATFYQHPGIDMSRIFSALISDIRSVSYVQGASTITQQVVRSYLLSRRKTITRKLKEAILALRIEKKLTKDEILNLYLNRIYLGSGAYGVEAASLRYFSKHCWDLDLPEASLIAGLAPAPSRYSPLKDFRSAKRRQWYVLTRMVQEGYISDTEAIDAYQSPLKITAIEKAGFTKYPYVSDYVKSLMSQRFGNDIFSKGALVNTTIVPRLQDAAIKAVRKGAIELEMRQGQYHGPVNNIDDMEKARLLAFQANQLAWRGLEPYHIYWAEVEKVSPLVVNLGKGLITLKKESYGWITPKGTWDPKDYLKPGDLIQVCYTGKGMIVSQEPVVQAALCAFDIKTSSMVAMVGGVDYSKNQFNRVMYAHRQSGSAIKPFIYSAAIDKGLTPATIIVDTPITYRDKEQDKTWRPKNYEERFYGPTTLRTGLVLSRNVVTVKILRQIGIGYAIDYIKRFKLAKELPHDLSLALGSASIVPFDLVRAYGSFATHGFYFKPHVISSIVNSRSVPIFTVNKVVYQDKVDLPSTGVEVAKRILSEQTSYIITNMLTDVVKRGTGWRVKTLGRPVAGKTGTSNDNRDAWFIGYTPDILCGVWVGYDNMMPLGDNETGSRAASPIFVDFMKVALQGVPAKNFKVPDGIVFARVDIRTGQLATSTTPERFVRFECFKKGQLPPAEKPVSNEILLKEVY